MVESPTYYHSLSPVLRSLKEFDMENFPLQQEVIYARNSSQLPDYLQKAATVDTSTIYQEKTSQNSSWFSLISPNDISNGTMGFSRFLEIFNVNSSTLLEPSQCQALKQALMNRLAIIQGAYSRLEIILSVFGFHVCLFKCSSMNIWIKFHVGPHFCQLFSSMSLHM